MNMHVPVFIFSYSDVAVYTRYNKASNLKTDVKFLLWYIYHYPNYNIFNSHTSLCNHNLSILMKKVTLNLPNLRK